MPEVRELAPDPKFDKQRSSVEQALLEAEQAKEWAREIGEQYPIYRAWGRKWEQEAEALIASYLFFLDVSPIPSCYRFAAWIQGARFLLGEIERGLVLFERVEEA